MLRQEQVNNGYPPGRESSTRTRSPDGSEGNPPHVPRKFGRQNHRGCRFIGYCCVVVSIPACLGVLEVFLGLKVCVYMYDCVSICMWTGACPWCLCELCTRTNTSQIRAKCHMCAQDHEQCRIQSSPTLVLQEALKGAHHLPPKNQKSHCDGLYVLVCVCVCVCIRKVHACARACT